jgi:hypothetical protein
MRILSQSASVFGSTSTIPWLVSVLPTALKILSATGSIRYFISSLTDTTGVRSPHRTAARGASVAGTGGGAGVDDEQAAIAAPSRTSPARAVKP